MFVHLVLLKWKKSVSKKDATSILQEIKTLKTLEGILGFRTGENFSDYGHGYTHGLVVSFSEKKYLIKYMDDPKHTRILKKLSEMCEDILAVDFEDSR